jgi:hypothetical protein
MVKAHRTGGGKRGRHFDGDIDPFVEAYLLQADEN